MTATQSEIHSTLTSLIEICKDGQQGFRTAAENIDDPVLKKTLGELSLQRSKFAGELQEAEIKLGEHDPKNSGSVSGAIHRGWINLKTAIVGKDRYQILAECEAGEDSAVKEYKKALDAELPDYIGAIVRQQYGEVQAAHDTMKSLRDAAKK
jgi:uncharacterized protein (TIGR02284 family)